VRFTFQAEGLSYNGTDSINGDACGMCNFKLAHKGDQCDGASCTVTYLPRNPAIHCLGPADQRLRLHVRSTLFSAALCAVFLAGVLGWIEWSVRRELRLAQIGRAVDGRIVERVTKFVRNRTIYRARYQFETPAGMRRTGWASASRPLWEHLLPGTPVTVLYDPDHPGRHCPAFAFRFVEFLSGPIPE
jgi:hypothetical protein